MSTLRSMAYASAFFVGWLFVTVGLVALLSIIHQRFLGLASAGLQGAFTDGVMVAVALTYMALGGSALTISELVKGQREDKNMTGLAMVYSTLMLATFPIFALALYWLLPEYLHVAITRLSASDW